MKNAVFDISLNLKSNGVNKIAKDKTNNNLYDFTANVDLFDYSNNLVFSSINTNFMNNNDIISFRINKEISSNYFKLYDYNENNIKKILCYYDEENDYILFIYQSPSNIKYFTLKDNRIIYNIDSISDTIQMKTYEKIEYNINGKFKEILSYGNLNIESISRNDSDSVVYENYGVDFYDFLIEDGVLIPERSFNNCYDYSFVSLKMLKMIIGDYII